MFSIQLKIGFVAVLCAWAIGTYVLLKSNISLRHQTEAAQQQLISLQAQNELTNQTLLKVEKAKNEEEKKAINGLVEISSKGHIDTRSGDNPEWMRSE